MRNIFLYNPKFFNSTPPVRSVRLSVIVCIFSFLFPFHLNMIIMKSKKKPILFDLSVVRPIPPPLRNVIFEYKSSSANIYPSYNPSISSSLLLNFLLLQTNIQQVMVNDLYFLNNTATY